MLHKELQGITPDEHKELMPKFTNFNEALEWVLLLLDLEESPMSYDKTQKDFFDLKTFDGIHLMCEKSDEFVNLKESFNGKGAWFMKPGKVKFNDIGNELNYKVINFGPSEDNSRHISMLKWRKMDIKEFRGKILHPGYTFEFSLANLIKDKWYTNRGYYNLTKPQKEDGTIDVVRPVIISKDRNLKIIGKDLEEMIINNTINFNMALSVTFTKYYVWHLYLKENPKSIGFKIPISPESCQDVFSLRDAPLSKDGRKKALVHFVKEHFRSIKAEEYSEEKRQVLVKQHLRGETKFNWKGLECHIIPAQYDINRVKTKKKFLDI